jgi:hypothetical protein
VPSRFGEGSELRENSSGCHARFQCEIDAKPSAKRVPHADFTRSWELRDSKFCTSTAASNTFKHLAILRSQSVIEESIFGNACSREPSQKILTAKLTAMSLNVGGYRRTEITSVCPRTLQFTML